MIPQPSNIRFQLGLLDATHRVPHVQRTWATRPWATHLVFPTAKAMGHPSGHTLCGVIVDCPFFRYVPGFAAVNYRGEIGYTIGHAQACVVQGVAGA